MTLKLCKASLAMVMINYYIIFTIRGSYIRNGTMIFTALTLIFMLADIGSGTSRLQIPKEIQTYFLFFIWIVLTAQFALSPSTAISGCVDFAQKLIYISAVFYICYKDRSIHFPVQMMFCVSVATAVIVITRGIDFSVRLELSRNVGENAYGNLLVLGVFCALWLFQIQFKVLPLAAISIILFTFMIALTGSRKSIYALAIILFGFYVLCKRSENQRESVQFLLGILTLVLLFYIATNYGGIVEQTSLFRRWFDPRYAQRAQESNEGRILFYKYAMNEFRHSPIWGIGIKNYAFKHGSYTHSTYAEVLACTGIVGVILFFRGYLSILKNLFHETGLMKSSVNPEGHVRESRLVFVFYLAYLFIGLGIGQMYDTVSMIELGMLIGYVALNRERAFYAGNEG